jgi:RNA polymerase sigma factor (sigma-70 family)
VLPGEWRKDRRVTRPALWLRGRPAALAIARDTYVRGMDADDIRQEALLALWVASGTFDAARGPWMPYARHAVRARMVDLMRATMKQKRTAVVVELDPERDRAGIDVEALVEQRDTIRRLAGAMPSLTDRERACLELAVNETVRENKPVHNAAWLARRKLRAAVA